MTRGGGRRAEVAEHVLWAKAFSVWLRPLIRHDWVAYAKRPFGGLREETIGEQIDGPRGAAIGAAAGFTAGWSRSCSA